MLRIKTVKYAIVCALSLALLCMVGCSQPAPPANEEPPVTVSSYIAAVNASSEELQTVLGDFATAVSESNVFEMQAKVEQASSVLDEMAAIEAPEEMADVKSKYEDATDSLKTALNDYVDLYVELDDARNGGEFDFSTYADRLEEVQKQYDNGLNSLEEADKLASEL